MGIKVLFIYPNSFGMNMLPPAIALFSAILKQHNHKVRVFDTTYYKTDHTIDSDGSKEERLNVVPFKKQMKKKNLEVKDTDWRDDVRKEVDEYKPDLIALSATEDMWELGIKILEEIILNEPIKSGHAYTKIVNFSGNILVLPIIKTETEAELSTCPDIFGVEISN